MAADPCLVDDLLAPDAVRDPHRVFATLRASAPVRWSEAHHGWLLTRYDDISQAFRNRALSSDRVRPLLRARRGEQSPAAARILELLSQWMVVTDPPEHTRLRRLAAGAFKQQRIAALTDRIQRQVDQLVDAFIAGGHRDLIEHVAYPLPAIVIDELLGTPPGERDKFRHWSDELALVAFGAGGDGRAERHERALRGLRELFDYLRDLIAVRRHHPGRDMLSALIAGDGSGDRLSEDELLAMCALMLFAGHETTTNSIANGVLTLLNHPDQLAKLREAGEVPAAAVEELLRFDGPIKAVIRWVKGDVEIGGERIRRGQRVYLCLASANRDSQRFVDAKTLRLDRNPNPHIAFGKGIHACIGAQLARMETRIALDTIIRRLPGLRLAGGVSWKSSLAARSLRALPVTHEAAPAHL